jgi:hypothetical protein
MTVRVIELEIVLLVVCILQIVVRETKIVVKVLREIVVLQFTVEYTRTYDSRVVVVSNIYDILLTIVVVVQVVCILLIVRE